jgi:NTP pyrophosphatase (non-canonical NTP hydrolase)
MNIDWVSWDFESDQPGGPDARAVVAGVVLEAYDDGSWAVDDETSEGRTSGYSLESAKAAAEARFRAGPPFDGLGAAAVRAFAFGAERWPGVAKLGEEAGEVVQVIGKLMMTYGAPAHWDGSDLRQRLQEEVADLSAAIDFVIMHCGLDEAAIVARSAEKLAKFERWHALKGET